jgi:aspartate racemase
MSGSYPPQVRLPGLLGMAVHTDMVYLRTLHARADTIRGHAVNSVRVHLFTLNFALLVEHVRSQDWRAAEALVVEGVERLHSAGADIAVVTSNTGSSLAEAVQDRLPMPLLSITDTTCRAAVDARCRRLGLLSTTRTSRSRTYHHAGERAGVEIVDPPAAVADDVEAVIFDELIGGKVSEAGVAVVRRAIDWFASQRCDGVAFACTDITHMVPVLNGTTPLAIFDSTILHAQAAADIALGEGGA